MENTNSKEELLKLLFSERILFYNLLMAQHERFPYMGYKEMADKIYNLTVSR